jgi:hypothetical protein
MTTPSVSRKILFALTLGVLAACVASGITEPTTPGASALRDQGVANLIECPTSESASNSALVTPLGGLVSVGGTSVSIPAGALLAPTTVTVTVPASQYMKVDVSVEGLEHFIFELPVTITLSYDRCNRSNIDHAPLVAWYVDSEDAPLELMGGVDNKLTRTVTFTTGHLSGYALAD